MKTLLLDSVSWDLTTDIKNNIAVASDPYSQAQDAASAMRLFQGELWYDTTRGLPYWLKVFSGIQPLSLVRSLFIAQAKFVPGVVSVSCFFTAFINRQLRGQVQIKTSTGSTATTVF